MGPSWGISLNRSMIFIWSMEWIEGERPDFLQLSPLAISSTLQVFGGALLLRPTSVYAEDLVVDDDAQRQKVKHVCEIMPYVGIAVFA